MNPNLELGGILIASLVGSWHCAGMCGPFSSFMSIRPDIKTTQIFYHLGRFITYSSLTAVLYLLALPVKAVVGTWLLYGVLALWLVFGIFGKSLLKWQIPKPLVQLNQRMLKLSGPLAGLSLGSVTTLLPCVWLYGFIGLAITKPSLLQAMSVIFVFWLGTLPALIITQHFVLKSNTVLRKYSRKLSLALMIALTVFSIWTHKPSHHNHTENSPAAAADDEECPMH